MRIYNTLSKTKDEFEPITPGAINMFVCGPTVYDYIHIGNARTFVIFDVIAKYLRSQDYKVNYIQNLTDIDDKIIKRATEAGQDPLALAQDFEAKFLADMQALGVTAVSQYIRATDHIPEVTKQVQQLISKGHVYLIEGDGYYFDLSTFPDYGKLSGRTSAMADDGVSRIDDNDLKRNRGDFCVWKLSKPGEPSWPSDLGAGRPGWHIEDTAITEQAFGPQYDIHGGGQDLMFPHHEAEIAQQESASGLKPFVRYWLHSGFLINKDQKMSKSLGNFTTLHQALQQYSAETLRFYFLSAHYRAPLDFSEEILDASQKGIEKIQDWLGLIELVISHTEQPEDAVTFDLNTFEKHFQEAMADDINTPSAISTIFSLINASNPAIMAKKLSAEEAKKLKDWVLKANTILGIVPAQPKIPQEILNIVAEREQAKANKNFAKADSLREQLTSLGYAIEDTAYGPLVKKI